MIRRETDAGLVNFIANHPSVKPTFGYNPGPTDLTAIFAEPDAYVVLSNGLDGAALFEWSAPRIWQSHVLFLPTCRGRAAADAARAMMAWMFAEMNARLLWGQTPVAHQPALIFNRLIGAVPDGEGTDLNGTVVRYFIVEKF